MITREQAAAMLADLVEAEVDCVHQVNSRRGLTKRASLRERKAISAIFVALTGARPSTEEFQSISS